MSSKNKIIKNISWLFFDKAIRILGGIFIGVWLARYLGPYDFGLLNYALAYTAFFSVFVHLGLNQIVIRELLKQPKITPYLLGTAFGLKLLGAFLAIMSILGSLLLMEMDAVKKLLILIIASGFIFQSIDVIDYFYQAKILSKYTVIARNIAFIVSSGLKVFLIVNEYEVIYFAATNVIDLILSGVFMIIIFRRNKYYIGTWRYSKEIAKRLMLYSWPLALSTLLISIYMKIDQVMIDALLNSEQVGVYSVAVRLSEFWIFIPSILISSLMPYFVELRKKNQLHYQQRLMQLYSVMFWMGICVGSVTFLFGETIIRLSFGEVYSGAYEALVFNIWSGIAISQGLARGIWLIGEDLQKYRLYNNLIGVSLNISMNLLLIPRFGIAGAAIATLVTQSLGVWFFSFLWKPLRVSTWNMIKAVNPIYLISFKR